jgi:glutathione S-transferase
MPGLELVSHHLCPYVQRAAIVLDEKGIAFDRTYVDLADKPDWFRPSRRSERCRSCG